MARRRDAGSGGAPGAAGPGTDNFTMVRPEHLNHHGFLFGGAMLRWVDEYAWITAALDFPGCSLVTRALDTVVFTEKVASGAILRFHVRWLRQGETSVTYSVRVFADEPGAAGEKEVFNTNITFVRLGPDGRKAPLPRSERLRSQGGPPAGHSAPPG